SSDSFIPNVSITTKNLSWLFQLLLVCPFPGVAIPAVRASLRHLYNVTSEMPSSFAICGTDSLFGGIMRLTMDCFCSCGYRTPFLFFISIDLRVIYLTITLKYRTTSILTVAGSVRDIEATRIVHLSPYGTM